MVVWERKDVIVGAETELLPAFAFHLLGRLSADRRDWIRARARDAQTVSGVPGAKPGPHTKSR